MFTIVNCQPDGTETVLKDNSGQQLQFESSAAAQAWLIDNPYDGAKIVGESAEIASHTTETEESKPIGTEDSDSAGDGESKPAEATGELEPEDAPSDSSDADKIVP